MAVSSLALSFSVMPEASAASKSNNGTTLTCPECYTHLQQLLAAFFFFNFFLNIIPQKILDQIGG